MLRMFRRASAMEHGRVWAITEPALRSLMEAAADRKTTVEAIARDWGQPAEGARGLRA